MVNIGFRGTVVNIGFRGTVVNIGFRGTVVNWTLPTLHGALFEITLTVPVHSFIVVASSVNQL